MAGDALTGEALAVDPLDVEAFALEDRTIISWLNQNGLPIPSEDEAYEHSRLDIIVG